MFLSNESPRRKINLKLLYALSGCGMCFILLIITNYFISNSGGNPIMLDTVSLLTFSYNKENSECLTYCSQECSTIEELSYEKENNEGEVHTKTIDYYLKSNNKVATNKNNFKRSQNYTKPLKDLKVALMICGQMRTYETAHHGLQKYVIKPLNPDIFIYTSSNKGASKRWKQDPGYPGDDKFANDPITEQKLFDTYGKLRIKGLAIEKEDDDNKIEMHGVSKSAEFKKTKEIHGGGTIPNAWNMYKCNNLKSKYERDHLFMYDIVIKVRPDLTFLGEIPETLIHAATIRRDTLFDSNYPHNLYNPSHGFQPSEMVSDKFAFGSSWAMNYYTSLFIKLPFYWQNEDWRQSGVGERLMHYHIQNNTDINRQIMGVRVHFAAPDFCKTRTCKGY